MTAYLDASDLPFGATYVPFRRLPQRIDVPDGVLEVQTSLSAAEVLELKDAWESRYDWFKASAHG